MQLVNPCHHATLLTPINPGVYQAKGNTAISVADLAKILLRSPQKMFIFVIEKYIYRMKESKNKLI